MSRELQTTLGGTNGAGTGPADRKTVALIPPEKRFAWHVRKQPAYLVAMLHGNHLCQAGLTRCSTHRAHRRSVSFHGQGRSSGHHG